MKVEVAAARRPLLPFKLADLNGCCATYSCSAYFKSERQIFRPPTGRIRPKVASRLGDAHLRAYP